MNRFKIVVLSLLIAVTGSLATTRGVGAQEPGLPGTLIPGNRLFATGTEIWLQFLGGFAGYDIDLVLFDLVGQSHSSLPVIFKNHPGPSDSDVYHASGFTPGDELIFGIFVQNTGYTYYIGPPENNPDDALHVRFFDTSDTSDGFYTIGVGFEDLYGGGDEDYQDIFFQARGVSTVAPEPATLLLLGSGLLGLGGVGLVRRRRREDEMAP